MAMTELVEALHLLARQPLLWIPGIAGGFSAAILWLIFVYSGAFFAGRLLIIFGLIVVFFLAGMLALIRENGGDLGTLLANGRREFFRVLLPQLVVVFMILLVFVLLVLTLTLVGASPDPTLIVFLSFGVFLPSILLTFFADTAAVFENRKVFDAIQRSIELVSSQDPALYVPQPDSSFEAQRYSVEGPAGYFELLRDRLAAAGGGMMTSNIPPVDTGSFRRLRAAGLDCYLVWLETFQTSQYERLHPARSPKANQAFRLDSFERAAEAGIPHLAGAFLKGLYDWRREEAVLYGLDRHLKSRRGRGFSVIGTPRLKGDFVAAAPVHPYQVPDDEYELNVALDRILYDGILWLQTRESFATNARLIGRYGAGVILTLTSCTAPGGYARPASARSQFPVHKQGLAESVAELEGKGFRAVFAWTADTLTAFQRAAGSGRQE
jgi:hypothetical protein